MTERPDLRDLVGDDLSPEERARLERVHELLVAAGPPAELPPGLETPSTEAPQYREDVTHLPRRRVGAALALAAAIALIAFLGGYLAGHHKGGKTGFTAVRHVTLHGTARQPDGVAVVKIGRTDSNGNLPMLVTVSGLKRLPDDGYYTLALTKHGRAVVACGTFRVRSTNGSLTVPMTVAYNVERFDGWVVTEYQHGRTAEPVVLTS
jgi:ferric-dicitrate binding protein FerR (iron transport regulator)